MRRLSSSHQNKCLAPEDCDWSVHITELSSHLAILKILPSEEHIQKCIQLLLWLGSSSVSSCTLSRTIIHPEVKRDSLKLTTNRKQLLPASPNKLYTTPLILWVRLLMLRLIGFLSRHSCSASWYFHSFTPAKQHLNHTSLRVLCCHISLLWNTLPPAFNVYFQCQFIGWWERNQRGNVGTSKITVDSVLWIHVPVSLYAKDASAYYKVALAGSLASWRGRIRALLSWLRGCDEVAVRGSHDGSFFLFFLFCEWTRKCQS